VLVAGEVGGVSGRCPDVSFSVRGFRIVADGSTNYPGKADCKDVKNGRAAGIDGFKQSDGSVRAITIAVQKGDHDDAIQQ
jgi:hypothetical protein